MRRVSHQRVDGMRSSAVVKRSNMSTRGSSSNPGAGWVREGESYSPPRACVALPFGSPLRLARADSAFDPVAIDWFEYEGSDEKRQPAGRDRDAPMFTPPEILAEVESALAVLDQP